MVTKTAKDLNVTEQDGSIRILFLGQALQALIHLPGNWSNAL
jgi:hypothetical protein